MAKSKRSTPAKRAPRAKRQDAAEPATRADGWTKNDLTGIGTSGDRRRLTTIIEPILLTPQDMSSIYRGSGLGRRIVDRRVDDACRHWFKVQGDEEGKVKMRMDEIGAQAAVSRAWKMGRLYGGSIGLILVNDGQPLEEPVNENAISSVDGIVVFDRRDMFVEWTSVNKDVSSGRFMLPDIYKIMPLTGGEIFGVHHTRCIRFDGDVIGWREFQRNNFWHDSVLQVCFDALRQFASVLDSSEFIVEQFVINILKMPGLMSILKQKDKDSLKARLTLLDQSMHSANHVLLDAAEEYQRVVSTVAGLPDLVQQFMMSLTASSGYPLTLLFGQSPAGLNATGESDIMLYYDSVAADQINVLKPQLERLVKYTFLSLKKSDDWTIVFNPLRQMSDKERSELYKMTAEGDAIYVDRSCISPEAIAKHRFVGEEFNPTPPAISEEDWEQEEALREEERERQLSQMEAQSQQAGQGDAGDEGGDRAAD